MVKVSLGRVTKSTGMWGELRDPLFAVVGRGQSKRAELAPRRYCLFAVVGRVACTLRCRTERASQQTKGVCSNGEADLLVLKNNSQVLPRPRTRGTSDLSSKMLTIIAGSLPPTAAARCP